MYLNKKDKDIFTYLVFFELVRLYKDHKDDLSEVHGNIMELEELFFKLNPIDRKSYEHKLYLYRAIDK